MFAALRSGLWTRTVSTASNGAARFASTTAVEAPLSERQYLKVTLTRSLIGLTKKTNRIALALGLRKRGRYTIVPATPGTVGTIVHLKEVVQVKRATAEEVDIYQRTGAHHVRNPAPRGFRVVGNVLEEQKKLAGL